MGAEETAEQKRARLAGYLEKYKRMLLDIIEHHVPACRVYLFGSRATGTGREGADVDVAIDCGDKIHRDIVLKIIGDVDESDLPVFVDIVDLQNVSSEMQEQILKEGVIWKN